MRANDVVLVLWGSHVATVCDSAPTAFVQTTRNSHLDRAKSAKLHMSVPNSIDTLTSGLASVARLPYGVTVSEESKAPADQGDARISILFDVENSPACRSVRERVTELDLVVSKVVPAAENSRVFLDPSYEFTLPIGTKIPRMIVSDDGSEIEVEGSDIVPFLNSKFSEDGGVDRTSGSDEVGETNDKILQALNGPTNYLSTFLRFGRGAKVTPAAAAFSKAPRPSKPLILYSYEGNQFCRLVREVLTELDIVYELRSAGKMSPRRNDMAEITGGSTQCPFLIDENTGERLFESADIIQYLYKTYALWTPPSEILEAASSVITPLLKPVYKYLAPIQAGSNGEDKQAYEKGMIDAKKKIGEEISSAPVVVYTYSLSPFCSEATALLDNIGINYKEISLGKEWIPGLITEEGAKKRAALGEMTGQTSLPHVFIGGKSIGGLFSGDPGLVPCLKEGELMTLIKKANGQ